MADELAKKISELDTLPGGNLDGYFTIGSKNNASGSPVSYKLNLGVITAALAQAAAAVTAANSATAAANAARAAFIAAIVQTIGDATDKVMSQKAVSDLYDTLITTINALTGSVGDNADAITAIEGKIPTQATSQNQLADKAFVNSSIASQTSNLVTYNGGPFPSYEALSSVTASPHDYAYVAVTVSGGTYYDRYKYEGGVWVFEYRLNSTVFTAAQWAALNSGITTALVTKLSGLPDSYDRITNEEIDELAV